MNRVLAIDQSLVCSGIAHCDWDDLTLPRFTSTTIEPKMMGTERLIWIRDSILKAAEGCVPVLMEGYSYGSPNGMAALGELGGVLRVGLLEAGKRVIVVSPSEIKQWATGKGLCKKPEMLKAAILYKRFGDDVPTDDNRIDALWLCDIGYHLAADVEPSNAIRRKILDAIQERTTPGYKKPSKPRKQKVKV